MYNGHNRTSRSVNQKIHQRMMNQADDAKRETRQAIESLMNRNEPKSDRLYGYQSNQDAAAPGNQSQELHQLNQILTAENNALKEKLGIHVSKANHHETLGQRIAEELKTAKMLHINTVTLKDQEIGEHKSRIMDMHQERTKVSQQMQEKATLIEKLKFQISHHIGNTEKEKQALQAREHEINLLKAEHSNAMNDHTNTINQLHAQLSGHKARADGAEARNAHVERQFNDLQRSHNDLARNGSNIANDLDTKNREIEMHRQRANSISQAHDTLKNAHFKLKSKLDNILNDHNTTMEEKERYIMNLVNQLENSKKNFQAMSDNIKSLKAEHANYQAKLAQGAQAHMTLKQQVAVHQQEVKDKAMSFEELYHRTRYLEESNVKKEVMLKEAEEMYIDVLHINKQLKRDLHQLTHTVRAYSL